MVSEVTIAPSRSEYGRAPSIAWLSGGGDVPCQRLALSGGTVAYFDSRPDTNEPGVLLLHGIGNSSVVWGGVWGELSAATRVVAVDLPGFGLSRSYGGSLVSADVAAALVELAGQIGFSATVIVGHSLGGLVALSLASDPRLSRSAGLERLVLLGTPPLGLIRAITSPFESLFARPRSAALAVGMRVFGALPGQERVVRAGLETKLGRFTNGATTTADYSSLPPETRQLVDEIFSGGDFRRALANSWTFDPAEEWAGITAQVQLILGDKDHFTSTADAREFFSLCSTGAGSQLTFVKHCGHLSMLEWPQLVVDLALARSPRVGDVRVRPD